MMVKEKAHITVIQLYYTLLRLTRRWPNNVQKAQHSAQAVTADAKERAENVGVTVSEGAKLVIEQGRKAIKDD